MLIFTQNIFSKNKLSKFHLSKKEATMNFIGS